MSFAKSLLNYMKEEHNYSLKHIYVNICFKENATYGNVD